MRSKLFVPGSRPELFGKAMASAADAVSFDLEDAVAADRKAEARAHVAKFLAARGSGDGKRVIVRVNAPGTAHFEADIAAVLRPGLDMVNLPMVQSADDIAAVARPIERSGLPITILANIETPRGLRLAADIAMAHRLVTGLQVGFGDLFEPFGIHRREPAALQHVLVQMRMAAAEAGIAAYDGALADVSDPERFRAECLFARRLGYLGKSCIHPSQIAVANESFLPDAAAVAWARKVVAASETAGAAGVGAFLVEGRMVDGPFITSARELVATAERLGIR